MLTGHSQAGSVHPATVQPATLLTTSPTQRCAQYLRSVYNRQTMPVYDKCPPTSSKKFINLLIIPKEQPNKRETEEFIKATIHGNIEAIMRKKENFELCVVGKLEDGSIAQCVLIQGARPP